MSEMPPEIRAIFDSYPEPARSQLLALRDLIFQVAGDAPVTETLKWGQPSYRAPKGSPIRLGVTKEGAVALYAICTTTLIETFRQGPGAHLTFEKTRAVLPRPDQLDTLRPLIAHVLTYHA